MKTLSPYPLMHTFFAGFGGSVALGAAGTAASYATGGMADAQAFLRAFALDYNVLLSLGLILGTALIVYRSQDVIPSTIETVFGTRELAHTEYAAYKAKFFSLRRTVNFAALLIILAFVIFRYSKFPLTQVGENIMIGLACLQYALGSYVGRKLGYAGMMLHSLQRAPVRRNLFRHRELDDINTCVHVASSLTVIFVYLHVTAYYSGPFLYDTVFGRSPQPFLLLPAVIALPVLLMFNFYPRAVLRRIYSRSIDVELRRLKRALADEALSDFEKRSHVIEFDKMRREELRHSLQLTLSDLPIAITIAVMLLEPLLDR